MAFEDKSSIEGSIWNTLRLLGLHKPSTNKLGKRVAVPLLGAGCRDFPNHVAMDVAALESAAWLSNIDHEQTDEVDKRNNSDANRKGDDAVVFGLLEKADAEELSAKLETLLSN